MDASYIQMSLNACAAEMVAGNTQTGTDKVRQQNNDREQLEQVVEQKQKRLAELKVKLDEINDRCGFVKFIGGLFGSDGGLGETQDAMQLAAADMKRAQNEIKAEMNKIEGELKKMQAAFGEYGQRTKESDELDEGKDRALQSMF